MCAAFGRPLVAVLGGEEGYVLYLLLYLYLYLYLLIMFLPCFWGW